MRTLPRHPKRWTPFTRVLAVFAVATIAACGSDSATSPSASVQGTYALRTINGHTLQYVAGDSGGVVETITSATLTLNAGGTFTVRVGWSWAVAGSTSAGNDEVTGTYAISGNDLTLTAADGSVNRGTLSGSDLTVAVDGDTWIFAK